MSAPEASAVTQLQIRLLTKQPQYAVPDTPYAISSAVSTSELNDLVNAILNETLPDKKRITFDFIVCNEFLRASLSEHLQSHNVATESTVDVEYLEKLPAPKPHDCLTHDDWVSSISCRGNWIVVGSYDNSIHLWTTKGKHQLAIPGHTSPVKAVKWASVDNNTGIFISGSHDQTAMIWEWDIASNSVECLVACHGHDKSINCIDITADGSKFATGSWDTSIKVWNAAIREDGETANKRARIVTGQPRSALVTLNGHKESVSGVKWLEDNNLISSSWDHTIRFWDVEMGAPSRTIALHKPVFSLDRKQSTNMLITGSADRNIRIYDPRSNVDSPAVTVKGHTSWVSDVKWSPDHDDMLFISAGHDMLLKMWDIRSPHAALYELTGHTDKVLCCEWSGRLIMSGGADQALRIYKSRQP